MGLSVWVQELGRRADEWMSGKLAIPGSVLGKLWPAIKYEQTSRFDVEPLLFVKVCMNSRLWKRFMTEFTNFVEIIIIFVYLTEPR